MHSMTHHHNGKLGKTDTTQPAETQGLVMNLGWRYDLMVWAFDTLLFGGKLRKMRQRTINLAHLEPGEAVLDVGCGTGTLALEAYPRVGATGRVCGIDPGPQQIARARSKAARAGLPAEFQVGVIERLPFTDHAFDVVFSTLMMHHLSDDLKRQGLAEIARVLKPGGRLVIADFKRPEKGNDQPARFGAGETGIQDLAAFVKEAGFSEVETGDIPLVRIMGIPGAGFVRAHTS
jgi:ubiquinone/menaquinone biosynthesis C-methylase UbiE